MANNPFRIMLVEDSDDDAELIVRAVARYDSNIAVDRVKTIHDAIGTLREWGLSGEMPGLILVDGRIAGLDATEFFTCLRSEGLPPLPSIVLTGTVDQHSTPKYLEAGALEVRSKPVDYAEFLELIAEILSRYRREP